MANSAPSRAQRFSRCLLERSRDLFRSNQSRSARFNSARSTSPSPIRSSSRSISGALDCQAAHLAQTSLAMLQFPANPLRYRVGFGLAVLLPFVVATLTALITRGTGEFQNRGAEICLMTIMAVSWLPFVFLLRLPRWKRILFAAVSLPLSFAGSILFEMWIACALFGNCPV